VALREAMTGCDDVYYCVVETRRPIPPLAPNTVTVIGKTVAQGMQGGRRG
jgi:hypothetical protein